MAHLLQLTPLVTEKSMHQAAHGKFTFVVRGKVAKLAIARAVRDIHSVHVLSVNIIKKPAKPKQRGYQSAITKALVTLKPGEVIKGFEIPVAEPDTKDKAKTDTSKTTTAVGK